MLTTEGPVLVLAGAGTGKTRVITYRVAYLIEKGVPGDAILAVTFTNKAAEVMKRRIHQLLRAAGHDPSGVWISTFHSFCARLLRREAHHLDLPHDFTIFDDGDQTAIVKLAIEQLGLSDRDLTPRAVREQISDAKNRKMTADDLEAAAFDQTRRKVAQVFRAYDDILRKASGLDFDDLLLRAVELLRNPNDVLSVWSSRCQYLMVDEFQDTNPVQEELVRLLASSRRNVCVVGDEDQSIYTWRGVDAGSLKRFTDDFRTAKVIRLEENYRSTQTILDAAAAVVAHNTNRLGKRLQATLGAGHSLRFFEAPDATSEAGFICGQLSSLVRRDLNARLAVLYRTGAQSRPFEELLRRLGIRYRVVGGFSFYEREEVRNVIAYVRLLFHPQDDVAFLRALNVPPRGIGTATVAAIQARAKGTGKPLWNVIGAPEPVSGRKAGALQAFRMLIEGLQNECRGLAPAQMIKRVLDQTGYLAWVQQQDNLQSTSRAENLLELVNAVAEATEQGQTLEEILDQAALTSDADAYDETIPVSLMTLHSAKGLEFDAVFIAGLEEGLLPHGRSLDRAGDIEEERRLFYVGMTRAKQSLALSRAIYRRIYGEERLRASLPSRFLAEIPGELIEMVPGSISGPGETRRYEPDPDFSNYSSHRSPARSASRTSYGRPGQTRAVRPSSNPLVGMRVRHPKYGVGTILEVEGEGEDRKLTVSFQDYGAKKLVERYANLRLA